MFGQQFTQSRYDGPQKRKRRKEERIHSSMRHRALSGRESGLGHMSGIFATTPFNPINIRVAVNMAAKAPFTFYPFRFLALWLLWTLITSTGDTSLTVRMYTNAFHDFILAVFMPVSACVWCMELNVPKRHTGGVVRGLGLICTAGVLYHTSAVAAVAVFWWDLNRITLLYLGACERTPGE